MTNSMNLAGGGTLLLAPHRASPARRPCCRATLAPSLSASASHSMSSHATAFLLSGAAQWITGSALSIDGRFTAQ